MATVSLTKENFNDIVGSNSIVVMDFWAEWCGPCKQFGPIFEKVSNEYEDVVFGKINTEEQQELAALNSNSYDYERPNSSFFTSWFNPRRWFKRFNFSS